MIAKKKRTRSHIFWRKHLSLQRNQVFWRVLSQGDIIECISFFVDKLDVVDVKNACPQFSTFCHSSDNLKKKNTWFLQAYKFCFADFSKTSNNFRNRGYVFWRYTKYYSSTESQVRSVMCSQVGALQKIYFFLKNSWFLCNSKHFRKLNVMRMLL